MKDKNAPSLWKPEILFLSLFGIGFIPKAPGTWGTVAMLPFLYLLTVLETPPFLLVPFIIVVTIISSFLSEYVQKQNELHDPGWIVIDEALGISVAWLFMSGNQPHHLLFIFALFRFFDIVKPFPINYLDKNIKHGAGVIIDDIVSGLFAGLIYSLGNFIFLHFYA
jgi:phosphatidylglycerophosphatase A